METLVFNSFLRESWPFKSCEAAPLGNVYTDMVEHGAPLCLVHGPRACELSYTTGWARVSH